MVSDKLLEKAMNGRYDGTDTCDIAREVLELEAKLKAEELIKKRLQEQIKAKDEAYIKRIRTFTSHKDDCHFMYDPPDHPDGRCTCGLESTLKGE